MGQLALTNFVNISVAQSNTGVNAYNTSNLAVMTDELPANSFGNLGYNIYLGPSQVATDFGSASKTFGMANAIFSQQPNILAGGGALIVITMISAVQHLAFSGTAASGTFILTFATNPSAAINWNDTAAQIQTKIQAVPGASKFVVTGSIAAGLNITMYGAYGAQSLMTTSSNTLQTSGSSAITITVTTGTAGESWSACLARTQGLVQYFGHMVAHTVAEIGNTDVQLAAAATQALNKLAFCVSYTEADIQASGILANLQTATLTQTRGLFRDESTSYLNCINFMAAYAGRGLSTNFNGSNTTSTMNLKQLLGITPDPNITQAILAEAIIAGADVYPSFQGNPAVYCTGANDFFDNQYNLQWLIGALQVAGYNYLASSSTKIPQTEIGMDGLKSAYRAVLQQAVSNAYLAPGAWNSSTTFGNQTSFLANISQYGYYMFSQPVAQQAQSARAARQAPLVQIAIKLAGAIQSSQVVININP